MRKMLCRAHVLAQLSLGMKEKVYLLKTWVLRFVFLAAVSVWVRDPPPPPALRAHLVTKGQWLLVIHTFPLPTWHPSLPRRRSTPTLYLNPTLTLTPTPTLNLLLTLHLTLPLTLTRIEYWDRAGGGRNIV